MMILYIWAVSLTILAALRAWVVFEQYRAGASWAEVLNDQLEVRTNALMLALAPAFAATVVYNLLGPAMDALDGWLDRLLND